MSPCKRCHFNGGGDICERGRERGGETDRQTWSDREEKRENASVHIWLTVKGQFTAGISVWDLN